MSSHPTANDVNNAANYLPIALQILFAGGFVAFMILVSSLVGPSRKTDDKFEFESVLTYKLGTFVNPYASATFKSQFADGFKYNDAPF